MNASSKLLGGLLIVLTTVSCITGNKRDSGRKTFERLSGCGRICSSG